MHASESSGEHPHTHAHTYALTHRSGAVYFSSERNNLRNLHSFKYSGIANTRTVAVNESRESTKDRKARMQEASENETAVKPQKRQHVVLTTTVSA